jgi:hypothetical protein
LITVAQAAVKEKVIRVIIATFSVSACFLSSAMFDADVLEESDYEGAFRESSGYACRAASSIFQEPFNSQMVRRGHFGGRTVRQR